MNAKRKKKSFFLFYEKRYHNVSSLYHDVTNEALLSFTKFKILLWGKLRSRILFTLILNVGSTIQGAELPAWISGEAEHHHSFFPFHFQTVDMMGLEALCSTPMIFLPGRDVPSNYEPKKTISFLCCIWKCFIQTKLIYCFSTFKWYKIKEKCNHCIE